MKTQELNGELHSRALLLGKEFHRICTQNGIDYFMLGGSMLGAVRHKGFIPWDDDMDFGVKRKDFQKLILLLEKELPHKYKLISRKNTSGFYGGFIKIEDSETLIKEELTDFAYGVSIDIFPLDRTNGNFSPFSKNRIINTLYKIQNYRFYSLKNYSPTKRFISHILHLIKFPPDKDFVFKITEKYLLKDKGNFLANHYGAWGMKETVEEKIFSKPVLYDFEDTKFYGVSESDAYLKALYGENYMSLPPKEKRINHIKEIKIIK
ncbi:MAG: LicD family protein [Bacteroidales bacterium]|nr:LicD family protein [Bacteroidales bacterium]